MNNVRLYIVYDFFSTHSEPNFKKHFMFAFFWNFFFRLIIFVYAKIYINVDITCIVWYFIGIAHGYGSLALWHCFNRIVFGSCSFICGYFMVYSFFWNEIYIPQCTCDFKSYIIFVLNREGIIINYISLCKTPFISTKS